jgi:hypothetical protein
MSNMSYCRFQNTLPDLEDCEEHITDNDLSEEEEKAKKRLVETCKLIIERLGND